MVSAGEGWWRPTACTALRPRVPAWRAVVSIVGVGAESLKMHLVCVCVDDDVPKKSGLRLLCGGARRERALERDERRERER